MTLPIYCSPEDAFKLSDCPDPWTFVQKLHRLFLEGMPSTARRYVRDSERENVPQITWIDCRPILLGQVVCKYFFRYHRHPDGHRTCERLEFRGYDKAAALIGPTWIDEPRIWFVDLRFLTADFEAAWARSGGDELAPAAPSEDELKDLILAEAAKNGGYIAQKPAIKIVRTYHPGVKYERAREIVKAVIGNEKTGPRGPRK
jgi:hypothetical protein